MNIKQPKRITLRASEEQKIKIRNRATEGNHTMQKFVLDCALGCPPMMSASDAKAIIGELRRIGNNLNQIAHTKNMGKPINKYDLNSNVEEVERICQSLKPLTALPTLREL